MRTFTIKDGVQETVYNGFNKDFSTDANGKCPEYVAIAVVEGEPEVWVLDSPECIRQLDIFYWEQFLYKGTHYKIYTQSGFWSNPRVYESEASVETKWPNS